MIKVIGEQLHQYQKERKVSVSPLQGTDIKKLTFEKNGIQYAGSVETDGTAKIPDALLISAGILVVKTECVCNNGYKRSEKECFNVEKAERPADYTKPEVKEKSTGVTSWNDLMDKPFGEVETTEVVLDETVLSQFSFTMDIYANLDGTAKLLIPMVANETYVLKIDGKEYVCTSGGYGEDVGHPVILIGNHDVSFGAGDADQSYSNPDCPMWIAYDLVADELALIANFDATGSTLSIHHVTKEIKKIDAKYLPDGTAESKPEGYGMTMNVSVVTVGDETRLTVEDTRTGTEIVRLTGGTYDAQTELYNFEENISIDTVEGSLYEYVTTYTPIMMKNEGNYCMRPCYPYYIDAMNQIIVFESLAKVKINIIM